MTEGDANSWKREFYNTAEQKAAQDGSTISLRTYKDFMNLIIKGFSLYNAPKDAIYEMKEMKMGNALIEEHVAKFKMLDTKSKLEKNEAVVEYFRETLLDLLISYINGDMDRNIWINAKSKMATEIQAEIKKSYHWKNKS